MQRFILSVHLENKEIFKWYYLIITGHENESWSGHGAEEQGH